VRNFGVPQPTEWQRIGNQNAAMIFARADFVNVFHYFDLRGNRLTATASTKPNYNSVALAVKDRR
jgi:hypothetical protein